MVAYNPNMTDFRRNEIYVHLLHVEICFPGATRKDIEGKLGKSVVSSDNYLQTPEKTKRMEYKKTLIE